MRKRTTPAKLQRLDEIISRALKKRHVPFQSGDRRLLAVWEGAVGPQIASQSRPEYLRRETLSVKVASSVWMHQLHFLKEEIIDKVNSGLGSTAVKDIRFTIGSVPPPPEVGHEVVAPLPPPGLLKERDKQMMEACLESLTDEELKEIIRRVMTREIIWRRSLERKVP